jgi:hypothetical protein
MTNHTHEIPGNPADNPSARDSECDGDMLLPLLSAPIEPVDADGTGNPASVAPLQRKRQRAPPAIGRRGQGPG